MLFFSSNISKKTSGLVKVILLILTLINLPEPVSAVPESYEPLKKTPLEILEAPREAWRFPDFELYTWTSLDRVLIFDFTSYSVQDRFLKRLAFFTEKLGFVGKVHLREDLKGHHGYNAHNYAARDLARFFNQAGAAITSEERLLKEILIANGILGLHPEGLHPNGGGFLSISRTSGDTLRRFLLIHELMHGIYYTLPQFEADVRRLWLRLSQKEKEFWMLYLESRNYDINNQGLVFNEFQAYLLQQQKENVGWLIGERGVADIKKLLPAHSSFAEDFAATCGECLFLQAVKVEALLEKASEDYGFDFVGAMNSLKLY